ncbi:M55 family metallopeptidase [Aminicella lysinilytica]|uniref:D-amino peptidase n=1 Tax=Aminicella lysinilytica TaxID=433323 RepID=A0A4R6Q015_9FIRM|nr:M55 family metallopeptidase [Aminicella lysinilytica]TDP51472.1 D-amino peptidase [Aminicella lysinilytica]
MKVFVSADIEGIAGVTSWDETLPGRLGYEEAQIQMNKEVTAACDAAIELGYEVVVKDGHDAGLNLHHDKLPKNVELIRGWMTTPESMMAGIDETYDAAIYIGYHSPEGSDTSCLAHTIEHSEFNWIKINNKIASEFTINRITADSYHVPSIFISGDEGICNLAKEESPSIVSVTTKISTGNSTWNKHPEVVTREIFEGVKNALLIRESIPIIPLESEYKLTINFKEHAKAKRAAWYPGVSRINSHIVEYTATTPLELRIAQMFMTGL